MANLRACWDFSSDLRLLALLLLPVPTKVTRFGRDTTGSDVVVDGSVRTQLNIVREAIAAQRMGSDLFE